MVTCGGIRGAFPVEEGSEFLSASMPPLLKSPPLIDV
jgi:hypothetical protein